MKNLKVLVAITSAALLLSLTFVFLPGTPTPKQDVRAFNSEKSKIMDSRQGYPDLFLQYHHDIRASENGVNEYPMGYRFKEYKKAITASKTAQTTLPWVERGPGNVGGRTRPLLVDPDDPSMQTWWAGSVSGGLWKTINGGLAWQYQTDDLLNMAVSSLAMAESNPDVIYMGTGEGYDNLDGVDGNGIFKSTDRGTSWQHLESTAENVNFRHVNRLAVDPSDPDVVLAATGAGIFRTADGGATWTEVYTGPGRVQDLQPQPNNFNVQIAGARGNGILYSEDAGMTWQLASVFFLDSAGRIELAYAPSDPSIAYAAVEGGTGAQLYRSSDGGKTWVPTVHSGPGNAINWLGAQGWYDNAVAVHPFDPSIVFVGGILLWRLIVSDQISTVSGPANLDLGGTQTWMEWVNFGASQFGGTVSYLDPDAVDVTEADYTNIEIRFGQGTQKAHRFSVSETAGAFGNGGSGIPFSEYIYEDYVDVPLQVWDTENNRQLPFSFRDQADDGVFDLIEFFTSQDPGTRDQQSREYMFIHKYDYDEVNPHADISQDGGLVNGMLYFIWPTLADGATWDPSSLSAQTITIQFQTVEGLLRTYDQAIDPNQSAHVDHHAILPIPINEAENKFWILNANDGGVALSSNNGTFFVETDRAFAGYNTAQFYGISKKPGNSVYMAGAQDNGTWRSFGNPDNRRGWTQMLGGDGFETVWHANDPGKVMGSIQFSFVLRSLNGGTSWVESLPFDQINGVFITSIGSSDAAPDDVYVIKGNGVYYSRDFGSTWTLASISSAWPKWAGGKVRVSIADPNIVWAGFGLDSDPSSLLYVSQDRGENYAATTLPTAVARPPETYISGLATHPTEAQTAYALFGRFGHAKVLETKDLGQTWTDLSSFNASGKSTNGFPDVAVHDLIVMPHSPNVLWAGTDIGLFKSKSYGKEWNYAHNGLPAVSVWRMKIRDDEIIVGTHGRGVWTVPLGTVDTEVEEGAEEVPAEITLDQNYPNPFNASTTIQFTVAAEERVRITVFDAAGRKVSVLTDRDYAPGVHQVNWNANAFASGVYFYRMESGGKLIQTHKMTLLK